MKLQIQWEFDLPEEESHDQFARENGVPTMVDTQDFLDDPEQSSFDKIVEMLSEEYGWLIQYINIVDEVVKT